MKKTARILLVISILTFAITSCSQYEDGPSLTLLSKKARITNVWILHSRITSDDEETYLNSTYVYILTLRKDGTGSVDITFGYYNQKGDAAWELLNDNKEIEIKTKLCGADNWEHIDVGEITMLKNNELHIYYPNSQSTYVYISSNITPELTYQISE